MNFYSLFIYLFIYLFIGFINIIGDIRRRECLIFSMIANSNFLKRYYNVKPIEGQQLVHERYVEAEIRVQRKEAELV